MKKLNMPKSSITKDFYQAQDNAYEYTILNGLIYTKIITIKKIVCLFDVPTINGEINME